MVFANTLHQNPIVIILPSPVSEIESKVFLFSEFSSSFILAAGPCILGRGSKCPGVGTGLLEQYGILRAWKQIVKRKVSIHLNYGLNQVAVGKCLIPSQPIPEAGVFCLK